MARVQPPPKRPGQQRGPRRIAGALLDIESAAAELGITARAYRARAQRGQVPVPRRFGGRLVVLRSELDRWLLELPMSKELRLHEAGRAALSDNHEYLQDRTAPRRSRIGRDPARNAAHLRLEIGRKRNGHPDDSGAWPLGRYPDGTAIRQCDRAQEAGGYRETVRNSPPRFPPADSAKPVSVGSATGIRTLV